jgi:hypothetical protein
VLLFFPWSTCGLAWNVNAYALTVLWTAVSRGCLKWLAQCMRYPRTSLLPWPCWLLRHTCSFCPKYSALPCLVLPCHGHAAWHLCSYSVHPSQKRQASCFNHGLLRRCFCCTIVNQHETPLVYSFTTHRSSPRVRYTQPFVAPCSPRLAANVPAVMCYDVVRIRLSQAQRLARPLVSTKHETKTRRRLESTNIGLYPLLWADVHYRRL